MIRSVCIIGYGSIGQKHYKKLLKIFDRDKIYVYSRRNLKLRNSFKTLNEIITLDPDYFIISNETSLHYKFLRFINTNFKNKVILCEKPLYLRPFSLKLKNNNKVYVGYNLRFDPIIIELKKVIKNKKIYNVKVSCNSYLPNWRKRKYSLTSSANIDLSGGVLMDLSHEIDYSNLLFGPLKLNNFIYDKLSDLKIKSKDYFNGNFFNKKNQININLSYYSISEKRTLEIYGKNFYVLADLHKRLITTKSIRSQNKQIIKISDTYLKMHEDIIFNNAKNCCSFSEGLSLLKIINKVKI